jgi:hypothetical protein
MADPSNPSWEDEFPDYNPRAPVMGDRAKQLANPPVKVPSWEDEFPTITTQDANRASRPRNWGETIHSLATETLKGIPIAGNYMPNLIAKGQEYWHGGKYEDKLANIEAQSKSFGEDNPLTTMGLRTAGGVLSTAPLSGALGVGSVPYNMASNAALFGSLAAGDTAAKRYKETGQVPDYPELQKDFASGAFWGGVPGPMLGKLLSLGGYTSKMPSGSSTGPVSPAVAARMQAATGKAPSAGATQTTFTPSTPRQIKANSEIWGPILGAGVSGAAGHFLGGHITEPAVLGALLGPPIFRKVAPSIEKHLLNRQMDPNTQHILNSLIAQKGQRPLDER